MANFSFVLEDDGILGFYPVKNAGALKSEEDIEELFDEIMSKDNRYKDRLVWNRPRIIGVVAGIVNWYDPKFVHDAEYRKEVLGLWTKIYQKKS